MPHGKNILSYFIALCLISRVLKYHHIVKAEGSHHLCVQHHFFLFLGCHLYAINTHHSRELRIVVAIRNKLLLITRKHSKPSGVTGMSLSSPLSESPVEEFQYIRVGFFFKSFHSWPRCPEADSLLPPRVCRPLGLPCGSVTGWGSPHLRPWFPRETKADSFPMPSSSFT